MLQVLWHRQLQLEEIWTNPEISIDLGFILLPVHEDGGQSMEHATQQGKAALCSSWADWRCSGTDKPSPSLKQPKEAGWILH